MPRDLEGLSRGRRRERGAPSEHAGAFRLDTRDIDSSSVRGTISRSRAHGRDSETDGNMEAEHSGDADFHSRGYETELRGQHEPARESGRRYNIRNTSRRFDDGEDIRRVFGEHRQPRLQKLAGPETGASGYFTDSPTADAPIADDIIRARDTREPTGAATKQQRLQFTKEDAPPQKQPETVSEKAAAARHRADKAEAKLERARDHLK